MNISHPSLLFNLLFFPSLPSTTYVKWPWLCERGLINLTFSSSSLGLCLWPVSWALSMNRYSLNTQSTHYKGWTGSWWISGGLRVPSCQLCHVPHHSAFTRSAFSLRDQWRPEEVCVCYISPWPFSYKPLKQNKKNRRRQRRKQNVFNSVTETSVLWTIWSNIIPAWCWRSGEHRSRDDWLDGNERLSSARRDGVWERGGFHCQFLWAIDS